MGSVCARVCLCVCACAGACVRVRVCWVTSNICTAKLGNAHSKLHLCQSIPRFGPVFLFMSDGVFSSDSRGLLVLTCNTASCIGWRTQCCSAVSWTRTERRLAPPPPAWFFARCSGRRGRSRPPAPAGESRWSAGRARTRRRRAPAPRAPCALWAA